MASIFDDNYQNDLNPSSKDQNDGDKSPSARSKERKGLTPAEYASGRKTLFAKVERAFQLLEDAMRSADFSTAVKAAQIILDRTGYGPKSTVDVNTTSIDLTTLSREELAERANRVAVMLREKTGPKVEADQKTVH